MGPSESILGGCWIIVMCLEPAARPGGNDDNAHASQCCREQRNKANSPIRRASQELIDAFFMVNEDNVRQ